MKSSPLAKTCVWKKESELTLSPIVFKQRASSSDLGYFHRSLAQLDMHH